MAYQFILALGVPGKSLFSRGTAADRGDEIRLRRPKSRLEKLWRDRIGSQEMNLGQPIQSRWTVLTGAATVALALQGCTSPHPPVEQQPVPIVDRSTKVRDLQKQIRERDQRIEELTSQLEALKMIDLDPEKQKPLLKPPTTLRPLE